MYIRIVAFWLAALTWRAAAMKRSSWEASGDDSW
jgi:hypothetical protein